MAITSSRKGAIPLFTVAGIAVSLHWSWFLVAAFEIRQRRMYYSSLTWNIAEYVALFVIVLMHEFGHALACRQVGGQANRILLWPLGGIAYVAPPPRAGAYLWSIAAGPLVNVFLAGIFLTVRILAGEALLVSWPDAYAFLQALSYINLTILIFNILPIYPLDGGQIFRSLLWFAIGPEKSLRLASVLGVVGAVAIAALGLYQDSPWILVMAAFLGWRSIEAFRFSNAAIKNSQQIL